MLAFVGVCVLSSVSYGNPESDFIDAIEKDDDARATQIWDTHALNPNFFIEKNHFKGTTLFWWAAGQQRWDLVARMLELLPRPDINVTPLEGNDRGTTVPWWAAKNREWELVRAFVERYRYVDVNARPIDGAHVGKTMFWWVTANHEWELVTHLLRLYPNADINAAPLEGADRGKTPLWWAAANRRWDLVRQMLEINPQADVNAAALEGQRRGYSVLWWIAANSQWELLAWMLRLQPNANVYTAPAEGPAQGLNVLELIENNAPDALLERLVIHQMLRNVDGVDLVTQMTNPIPGAGHRITRKIFYLNFLLTAARNFFAHEYNGESYPPLFRRDAQWMLALTFLREGFRQLGHFTDRDQRMLLLRFLQVHPLENPAPVIPDEEDDEVLPIEEEPLREKRLRGEADDEAKDMQPNKEAVPNPDEVVDAEQEVDQDTFIREQIGGAKPRVPGHGQPGSRK